MIHRVADILQNHDDIPWLLECSDSFDLNKQSVESNTNK